jgi:general secretion pathway protein M
MNIINNAFDKIARKTGYGRLARRERSVLWGGILFICGFLVFQGVIAPYLDARQNLERSLQRTQNDLLEMQILQSQYEEMKRRQGEITRLVGRRDAGFSLFSFLEQQATTVRVKNRVTYMKPSTLDLDEGLKELAVEMKIERITLRQLIDFLDKVESVDKVVVVKRLAVQKNKKDSNLLDVVATIVTFEKKIETAAGSV